MKLPLVAGGQGRSAESIWSTGVGGAWIVGVALTILLAALVYSWVQGWST